ncbi:hypothetical protein ACK3YX_19785, partial [Aeromonas caviae]
MDISVLIGKKRWENEIKRKYYKHTWRPRKKTKQKHSYEIIHIHEEFCVYKAVNDNIQDVDTVREGANKRGNSSRLTQSFHFFMFEPIF